ncbi:MAG: RagB/SusD family nutrient uptake outer membrane protein [Saprospiraceae bacterium]|nr:RagB/SusD family nutrient uptake outer membrane protein [Candidatus Vicinibacter affinis]MBP6174471.1 RagB/SusD family nutrient uptake outer membrane protein [Saprospiraceae bacterium]MBK7302382.1 RagB/SusD family nutrient uptake outer membrane protein [Candidatus Vicinibacter affinis]MBK7798338.1 RagB/SusD family nutrient uptake outer membrane protein [Candidatus Vicinibacter affinis]MBK8405041.1 RagB/SusD family nutrient uptake outer membrane protein [Candidatus Vicinibacter affinis]
MKNLNKLSKTLLSSLVVVSLFFTACNDDFLDTTSKTSVDEKNAFSTPGKILAQVNNLYSQLQNSIFYGGRFIVFNEQRADEFGQNDGNAATGSAVWNQNVASTNEYINNVWAAGYRAINSANVLINQLQQTKVISDSLAKLYVAEAKFVRALSYLSLLQTYAKPYNLDKAALGLPLRLSPITSLGFNDLARSSVEEIYTQIIKDLNEAEADLPVAYATPLLNTSRAHKSSAIALKTRVFLNQSDYQKVMQESAKLVPNAPPYKYTAGSLSHNLEASFVNIFTGSYTGAEAIFFIPFANSNTETPASQFSLAFNYLAQPIIFLATLGIVSNPALSDAQDARSTLIGTNAAKQKVLRKFAITTAPFRDYVPVMRYAEVMLNYAEAATRTNDLALGAALLKAVRNRSNPNYVFPDEKINSADSLLNSIWTERRIEFLGEGLRLQDLQRNVLPLPAKTGSIGTAPAVPVTAKNYIWPIPSGELSTNALCLPN